MPLLNYFYENNDKLVVLFYEDDDRDADEIIEGLEGSGQLANMFTYKKDLTGVVITFTTGLDVQHTL